ncbi:MAG: ATP-binding protein [Chloroflexi bacterium]|nr:ATP-binding protein [Chloroflexota bacterium]
MDEKHVLTVSGRYVEVKKICQFVAQGAASVGLDKTAVFHIELACDEAGTNIIEHAYGDENAGDIHISWHVADDMFVVTMLDDGPRFDSDAIPAPTTVDNPNALDDLDNVRVGGLGIHFMRKLMDEVTFSYDPQRGNKLIMKKRISKPK